MSGCIPAVVNNTDGSFSGIKLADWITACPRSAKNLRNFSLKKLDVIFIKSSNIFKINVDVCDGSVTKWLIGY